MEFILTSVVSGMIGVVLGALFQKPIERAWESSIKRMKRALRALRKSGIPSPHRFSFGTKETTLVIIDGNGEDEYSPRSLVCHFDRSEIPLPAELENIRFRIAGREESKRSAGQPYMWNGNTYGLKRYVIGRTTIDEHMELSLWFYPSDWFTHVATSLSLDKESVTNSATGLPISLRAKYYASIDWSSPGAQPVEYFSNTFGVVMAAITSDEKLVIVKRSALVGPLRNVFNIAINEGVQRPFDRSDTNDAPDLYRTVIRGAAEELGLDIERRNVTFTGFQTDLSQGDWAMQGFVRIDCTFDELVKHRSLAAKDRWEGREVISVDFTPNTVVKFVAEHDAWNPGALGAIYLSLIHEHGRGRVEEAIKKHFR